MTRRGCPRESQVLAAIRRDTVDAAIAAHLVSCADCARTAALDRAIRSLVEEDDPEMFPTAESIRLEALLVAEQARNERLEAARVWLHALAFATCSALAVAISILDAGAGSPSFRYLGAAPLGTLAAVAMSMWGLVRAVDETTATP